MSSDLRRILVIEDDNAVSNLLSLVFETEGYAVTRIDSALGAVEVVRRLSPHAIVLDLGLPYKSGAMLLRELKQEPDVADIPVVVVSGLTESLTPARRKLAAAVVAKPFAPTALIDTVQSVITKAAPLTTP